MVWLMPGNICIAYRTEPFRQLIVVAPEKEESEVEMVDEGKYLLETVWQQTKQVVLQEVKESEV